MVNSSLKQIVDRLALIFDGDPWYGTPIKSALESVNPKYVFDSPGNGTHSIAELVAHMIAWRVFAEKRLQGETEHLPDQEQTFNWEPFSAKRKNAWDILINQLNTNQEQLLTLLRRQDEEILSQRVAGKPYTFQYLLTGILQHDLYHLGQIAYLNKLFQKKLTKSEFISYEFEVFSFESLALLK